jgi:AcrR family transcriptional regulator
VPRRPDPGVEERILNAALRLCQKGGEKALTMRAVARIAHTNTPTVYRRFKNRRDILLGLTQRVRDDLVKTLEPSRSPQETCVKYVQFASTHPYEYWLFQMHISELPQSIRAHKRSALWSTPIVNLIRKQLAEQLGGSSVEHTRLSLGLWALAHGTATLLHSNALPKHRLGELNAAFSAAVDALLSEGRRARP